MFKRIALFAFLILAGLWLTNNSLFARPPAGTKAQMIAHRGVHQTFHREGLTGQTCTATRIDAPTHDYLENTLPSMQAAFEAGAAVVEIDIHLTTDNRFAVFHDWTVDCRTDGTGVTHDLTLGALKALDIGYGYSADGGQTYPFRGAGVGLLPSLEDVFAAFPEGRFILNYKSNDIAEGEALIALLADHPEWRENVWGVYGGSAPTQAVMGVGGVKSLTRPAAKECLTGYMAMGWTGQVPEVCENMMLLVPINMAPYLWGWPHRFTARMNRAGTAVILIGDYAKGDPGTSGIDTPEDLARVPARFNGYVWTNKAEIIGPLLQQ